MAKAAKSASNPLTPEQVTEAVAIFKALNESKLDFEDYMQREYDQGKERGFLEAVAIVSQLVMDRAAEIWKRGGGDNDDNFGMQLEATALRKLSREIATIKYKK